MNRRLAELLRIAACTTLPLLSGACEFFVDDDYATPSQPVVVQASGPFAEVVGAQFFEGFFPRRNGFYTYAGLVEAAASYPGFCSEGDLDARKREAASFLANVARETGQLVYIEQIAKEPYCAANKKYPCAPGQQYYGRGPIQISWNYNYGAAGDALGVDLLSDPGLVARDAKVAWQTALWFWMTTKAGGETCHSTVVKGLGFGHTIDIINGAVECNGGNPDSVAERSRFYRSYCSALGVDPGENLTC
jgi:Chitinase class I